MRMFRVERRTISRCCTRRGGGDAAGGRAHARGPMLQLRAATSAPPPRMSARLGSFGCRRAELADDGVLGPSSGPPSGPHLLLAPPRRHGLAEVRLRKAIE